MVIQLKTRRFWLFSCMLAISLLDLGEGARERDECDLSQIPDVSRCTTRFEADIRARRSDDPIELQCCILARLENCLTEELQGRCPNQMNDKVRSSRKKVKVTTGCEQVSYPSITCYAFIYRDMISMAMLVTLMTFSCYALIVCCRACCIGKKTYRIAYGMKPVHLEHRPLIIVTQHH